MKKAGFVFVALAALMVLHGADVHAQAPAQEKKPPTALNASAGAFLGYQSATINDLDARLPIGGMLSFNISDSIRLGGYGLYSYGESSGELGAGSHYGVEALFLISQIHVGAAAGMTMVSTMEYDAYEEFEGGVSGHFGPVAGFDIPMNEKKDITLGLNGRFLFNSESGFSNSSFQTLLIGATLKAWFTL